MARSQACKVKEKKFHRDLEVRKLPVTAVVCLTKLLEDQCAWKKVMGLVRRDPTEANPCPRKYQAKHISMVEDAGRIQRRECTEIFLEEWGCSGRHRPTLGVLLDLLVEAELFTAVEYVSNELLKEPPPPRPSCGPAAKVITVSALESKSKPCSQPPIPLLPQPSAPLQLESSESDALFPVNVSKFADKVHANTESADPSPASYEVSESRRLAQEMDTLHITHNSSQSPSMKLIPYNELYEKTNGFDDHPTSEAGGHLLGSGAYGSVFLAVICEEMTAVKRLNKDASNIDRQLFFNEVEALSRIYHPNILQLLGYSCDGPAYCLVYEFMGNGNLQERLACQGKWSEALSWTDRIKIASGTAAGLMYLHSFSPRPLIHRDVKSANILLGRDLAHKLGDFGIVRFGRSGRETDPTTMTTFVFGTSAYMAPEAFRGDVSTRMDVFSFGVVLLELLTGLAPYDAGREGCDLVTHINEMCDNSIELLLDKKAGSWMSGKGKNVAEELYALALKCLEEKKDRPEMSTVVSCLQTLYN